MDYLLHDLGSLSGGEVVEVDLTSAAYVRLLSGSELENYQDGKKYRYVGGLAQTSPFRLQVPRAGHWYVAVDMKGLVGATRALVRVLRKPVSGAKRA